MVKVYVRERVRGRLQVVEQHDVTHQHRAERERLLAVLETAYPDRRRFTVEIKGGPYGLAN